MSFYKIIFFVLNSFAGPQSSKTLNEPLLESIEMISKEDQTKKAEKAAKKFFLSHWEILNHLIFSMEQSPYGLGKDFDLEKIKNKINPKKKFFLKDYI